MASLPNTSHASPHQPQAKEDARKSAAKRRRLRQAEEEWVRRDAPGASGGKGWFRSYVDAIVGNVQLTITNLHIRYEDAGSNPGHPISVRPSFAG